MLIYQSLGERTMWIHQELDLNFIFEKSNWRHYELKYTIIGVFNNLAVFIFGVFWVWRFLRLAFFWVWRKLSYTITSITLCYSILYASHLLIFKNYILVCLLNEPKGLCLHEANKINFFSITPKVQWRTDKYRELDGQTNI